MSEAIVLVGIQATGKSTFFCERFARTHVRINLDSLGTRHREELLLAACVDGGISFIVDNTNPTVVERSKYIRPAKAAGFRVIGYYFESRSRAAIERNAGRSLPEQVPELAIKGTSARLELPTIEEGFDELSYVRIGDDGGFVVEAWRDEVR